SVQEAFRIGLGLGLQLGAVLNLPEGVKDLLSLVLRVIRIGRIHVEDLSLVDCPGRHSSRASVRGAREIRSPALGRQGLRALWQAKMARSGYLRAPRGGRLT